MKFGITLPVRRISQSDADGHCPASSALASVVQQAEILGYDSLSVGDHIVVPSYWLPVAGESWYDPFTLLGYAAGLSSKIRLLTDVLVLPYRNPFTVAKAVATLDQFSGGRVIFGAAPGFLEAEFQTLRIPFAERGAMTDEYLRILRELWTQEEPQFEGRYYSFSRVRVSPKPLQKPHPPIWIGGSSRRAVRRAVEFGEGWVPFSLSPQELREALRYAGEVRRGLHVEKQLEVAVHIGRVELGPGGQRKGRRSFTGTSQQVEDDVAGYREAGATYALITFGGSSLGEYQQHLERFAREVMPTFA